MQQLWKRYKEVILYLFFGGCTTVVNIVVYYVCAHPLALGTVASTCCAWLAAVIFAYITNKIWVFESKSQGTKETLKEMASFFSCRIATGLADLAVMYVFVDLLHVNDVIVKIGSNVLVVVLNYLASKLIIFKKDGK